MQFGKFLFSNDIFDCGCNIDHTYEEVYKSKAVCSLATSLRAVQVYPNIWEVRSVLMCLKIYFVVLDHTEFLKE